MGNLLLSLISGILTGLSFNLPKFSFLVWFSLVGFLYAISRSGRKLRVFCGLIFGAAFYGTAIFWIGNVTKLGLVFLLSYLALYPAVFALWGAYFFKRPIKLISLASLWVVLEFLKENIWCGFGWANLGYSQYMHLNFVQVADLWGVKFISFMIVMVNVFIYELMFMPHFSGWRDAFSLSRMWKKGLGVVLVLLISCFIYSFFRREGLTEKQFLRVSLVQPNVSQELKWLKYRAGSITKKMEVLAKSTEKDDLVIFPETAWPYIYGEGRPDTLDDFVRRAKRDIFIGAVKKEKNSFYNTALLFSRDGKLKGTYRKINLVPFGEYVPLRKYLRFVNVINSLGDMSKGNKYTDFSYKGKKFSALICFEDIFPLFVSRISRSRDFLINITNDAWFGESPQAEQHLGIMVMRAIENRISIVRCANTGISGWVSFKGTVEKLKEGDKEIFFSGAGSFKISLNRKRSFYNRWGELFPLGCAVFLLAAAMVKAGDIKERKA